MKYIKFGLRANLIYPLLLLIFTFLRIVIRGLTVYLIKFDNMFFLVSIMFLGELIGGILLSIYHCSIFKNTSDEIDYKGITLVHTLLEPIDKKYKLYLLMFISSFFDFIQFIMQKHQLPRVNKDSYDILYIKLSSVTTISTALFSFCILNLQIYKHQLFSLIGITIGVVLVIFIENCFLEENNSIGFVSSIISLCSSYFFASMHSVLQKYLIEYNFIEISHLLIFEGIFGIVLSIPSAYFFGNSLNEIINIYNRENSDFIILIIFSFIFFFLSGGKNIYDLYTIKIFTPTTKVLIDTILNPILLIYTYSIYEEQKTKEKVILLIINFIISIIIDFFTLVYNEFLILFCNNLSHETYYEISLRASIDSLIES